MDKETTSFELLNHTADLGMLVRGKDLQELFTAGATALTDLMVKRISDLPPRQVSLTVDGDDLTDAFIRWLGEILYLLDGERLIVTGISALKISPSGHVEATVLAAPFDFEKDEIIHEIKAVTYHQASVKQTDNGWEARVIFDL